MMGTAYGLKGDKTFNTSCSEETANMYLKGFTMYTSILSIDQNLLQPYYDASDVMIQASNLLVACIIEQQAAQLNIRTNTPAGLGDLFYSIVQFPVEGFFQAKENPNI